MRGPIGEARAKEALGCRLEFAARRHTLLAPELLDAAHLVPPAEQAYAVRTSHKLVEARVDNLPWQAEVDVLAHLVRPRLHLERQLHHHAQAT